MKNVDRKEAKKRKERLVKYTVTKGTITLKHPKTLVI
jgi:hypothetical protein